MQSDKNIVFIINPIAGTRRKEVIANTIAERFSGKPHEVIFTEYPGHAYEIASQKAADGQHNIIAVGGDGTVNEVASALVNTACKLGIIPAGSGNGLARQLHIPVRLDQALDIISNHKVRTIDAGKVNDRYFFSNCGTGFDASVGKKFASDSKRGMRSYIRATIHRYIVYSPKKYVLRTENKKIRMEAFLVTFANSGQYGNNVYIAPNAIIDDGFLDLCVLRPFPKTSTLELGLRLFFKNIDQSPYLEVMRIKKASLKRKGRKRITIHIDGEPVRTRAKLKVKVIPEALQVMVPVSQRRKRILHYKPPGILDILQPKKAADTFQ